MFNFREPYCLTLLGPSGTGKSLLARLATGFFRRNMAHMQDRALTDGIWRCTGGFVQWGEALGSMLDGEWQRMSTYKGDFFLALDDITATHEKLRELSASKLYEILTARHGRRWTIITDNKSREQIAQLLDPRIASRLIRDGSICFEMPMETPDYALR